MAANLGLDALIDRIAALPANATGFASNLIALLKKLSSDSADNPFGTAALKDAGTAPGDVPELSAGGVLAPERLPAASQAQAGAVELATADEAKDGTDTARAVTPAGVNAAIQASSGGLVKINVYTSPGTHAWTREKGVTFIRLEAVGGGSGGTGDRYETKQVIRRERIGRENHRDVTRTERVLVSRGGPGRRGSYIDVLIDVRNAARATVKVGAGGQAGSRIDQPSGWQDATRFVRANGGNGSAAGNLQGAVPGSGVSFKNFSLYPGHGQGGDGGPGRTPTAGKPGFVRIFEYR